MDSPSSQSSQGPNNIGAERGGMAYSQNLSSQNPISQAPINPQEQKTEVGESAIERASKIRDDTLNSEKRIKEMITRFERQIAENILSGRVEMVPMKSQEERDQEKADQTIKKYFG
jgi:hypothetical protein